MAFQVKCRIWLENEDGGLVIGTGRERILDAIVDQGSMNKAAKQLKLPFRAVWGKIKSTEERCGFKLVDTTKVGSKLTPQGEELLQKYKDFLHECHNYVDAKFAEYFDKADFENDNNEND